MGTPCQNFANHNSKFKQDFFAGQKHNSFPNKTNPNSNVAGQKKFPVVS
jgi:hypothetical protein